MIKQCDLGPDQGLNLAILQARMTSTRLPGKVLAPILGQPMISRQVERLRRSRRIDHLLVATSTDATDDPLAQACAAINVAVFRGDLNDVLGRFCSALTAYPSTKAVVRLTADCPLTDFTVIDDLIALHHAQDADYSSNTLPERTYPHGLDAEVIRPSALLRADRESSDPYEREHVTPFLYRRPQEHRMSSLSRAPSLAHLRWTVDFPNDLTFVRGVYEQLYLTDPSFGIEAIKALSPNSSGGAV